MWGRALREPAQPTTFPSEDSEEWASGTRTRDSGRSPTPTHGWILNTVPK
jgi:hypothetical protein